MATEPLPIPQPKAIPIDAEGIRESFAHRMMAFTSRSPELSRVIEEVARGALAVANPGLFDPILHVLRENDRYLHCADFDYYRAAQDRASETYRRPGDRNGMSIRNVAGMGRFSSDRTLREYASEIWGVAPLRSAGGPLV